MYDLVEGILALSSSEEHSPLNIGNQEEWTILECAIEILTVTGFDRKIIFMPLPQDDPTRCRPDISRAKALLGWQPQIKLSQGLQLPFPYFQASLDKGSTLKA
ncbi:hypothetical protein [Granulicella arctica]|uniref:hypothetical protein n=1 Tax=Granulicella arctica TaxID=940613 RepID=UPI003D7C24C4